MYLTVVNVYLLSQKKKIKVDYKLYKERNMKIRKNQANTKRLPLQVVFFNIG